MTTERRRRRSPRQHEALKLFFENIGKRHGFEALALTTDDGLLIAGASASADSELDVEWMGIVDASRQRSQLDWEKRRLYVRRLLVNDLLCWLTSAGRSPGNVFDEDIRRILA